MDTISPLRHQPARYRTECPRPATLSFLLFSGWAITLLYFPSGLLHYLLGPKVYARDILMVLHLSATLAWLGSMRHGSRILRGTWMLVVPLLLLLPGLNRFLDPRSDTFIKWFVQWFDYIVIGYLLALRGVDGKSVRLFCILTLGIVAADYLTGFYEWRTGHYVIPIKWNEETAMGIILAAEGSLRGYIRLRGLQRDVFSFANMMAMGCISALATACLASRAPWTRIISMAAFAAFGWLLFVCGGRSSFAGIVAAALLAAALFVYPDLPRPALNTYLFVVTSVALVISYYGVGAITETVGSTLLANTHIGDSESAFMRDETWRDFFDRIEQYPSILVAGAPIAALFSKRISAIVEVADNQFIWSLYHFGIVGSLAFAAFFYRCLRMWVQGAARAAHLVLVLFLLMLVGDGVARESLFFLCSLPAFVACGYLLGCALPSSTHSHG